MQRSRDNFHDSKVPTSDPWIEPLKQYNPGRSWEVILKYVIIHTGRSRFGRVAMVPLRNLSMIKRDPT